MPNMQDTNDEADDIYAVAAFVTRTIIRSVAVENLLGLCISVELGTGSTLSFGPVSVTQSPAYSRKSQMVKGQCFSKKSGCEEEDETKYVCIYCNITFLLTMIH